jgi:emfourin
VKIIFRQSGGFAGLIKGAELDAEALDPQQAAELKRLLDQEPAAESKAAGKERDLYEYEIALEEDGRKRTLHFNDSQVPDALRPLLKVLKQKSKPRPPT